VTCLQKNPSKFQRYITQKEQSNTMETGTVKWFNDAKGYGSSAARTARTYLYTSRRFRRAASAACRKVSKCKFDVVKGPKGWQAENVKGA